MCQQLRWNLFWDAHCYGCIRKLEKERLPYCNGSFNTCMPNNQLILKEFFSKDSSFFFKISFFDFFWKFQHLKKKKIVLNLPTYYGISNLLLFHLGCFALLPVIIKYFLLSIYLLIWFSTVHHYLCQSQILSK